MLCVRNHYKRSSSKLVIARNSDHDHSQDYVCKWIKYATGEIRMKLMKTDDNATILFKALLSSSSHVVFIYHQPCGGFSPLLHSCRVTKVVEVKVCFYTHV